MNTEIQGRAAHVAAIRERAEAEMKAMGVDDAFIDRLVETFYGRVLKHPALGCTDHALAKRHELLIAHR